jgi:exonuclease SbcC
MLTLGAVTVEGFRGLPKEVSLLFDCPITLLVAENHQGKSSVLNAIEWCLFGDECVGAGSSIRERVGWEVVHRLCESAYVRLRLVEGSECWVVERRQKRSSKKSQSLTLTHPDGTQVEGNAAVQELASLVKVNYRDFFCTAYQHQECIRAVLTQEPRDRNDAIDRLLGLSTYRNLLDALRQAKVSDVQKQMLGSLEVFQAKLETALSTRRRDLDEKKMEAVNLGLTEADLTEAQAIERAAALRADIDLVAAEMTMSVPTFEEIRQWPDLKPFCVAAEGALASLLRQAPETKAQQELLTARDRAVRAKAGCEGALQGMEAVTTRIQSFIESNGARGSIETRVNDGKKRVTELEAHIRATSPKAKLVEEGIALLESGGLGIGNELCPLCGHEVVDLLVHLKAEWQHRLEHQISELRITREQHEIELRIWVQKLAQFASLETERKSAQTVLDYAAVAAAAASGRTLNASDDPIALCTRRIKEIDTALQKAGTALKSRQERVDQVRVRLAALLAVCEVLALQARIEVLDDICECKEFKELGLLRDEIAMLTADVDAIQSAVREASAQEANRKITSAQAAVQRYFLALAENPAVQHLELKVEQKANGNDYRVLDAEGKELAPILSQGDLNCLALAMFFGLAEARGGSQGLSIIMLDDPSQSLGEGHMQRLLNVLNQITDTKPTILATMDPGFGQMLQEGLVKAKAVHQLRNWTPRQGPQVTRIGTILGATA